MGQSGSILCLQTQTVPLGMIPKVRCEKMHNIQLQHGHIYNLGAV